VPPDRVSAFAPGRVNLVGEHTDYNDGLCLPFAIERGVTASAERRSGSEIEARALDLAEADRFEASEPAAASGWRGLVRGVTAELRRCGVELPGARIEIVGDLPRGAGLGSSAALCVALALALRALAGVEAEDRVTLARLCSRVENEWTSARTGLLDQMASLFGAPSTAVRIDMRTLELSAVPLEAGGWTLATLPSGADRSNAASGYNRRREECAAARAELGLESLRDAGPEDLERLPSPLDRRVRHVLAENERVDVAVTALRGGDPGALGPVLDLSHASLRDDFEASVPEVERAVVRAKAAGAVGARMMGGGFGGHVLALFPPGTAAPPDALRLAPAGGARLL
jgi:galactokinase